MKLHIVIDFKKCETKTFLSQDEAKAYIFANCTDSRGGEAVWNIIKTEHLFDHAGLLYVTSSLPFTSMMMAKVKQELDNGVNLLGSPQIVQKVVQ